MTDKDLEIVRLWAEICEQIGSIVKHPENNVPSEPAVDLLLMHGVAQQEG